MKSLKLSTGLFAAAASLGTYLASEVFRGKETRKGVALVHGAVAASGLGVLLYTALKEKRKDLIPPLGVFGAAVAGGSYLFFRDITGKKPQPSITAVHAAAAVTGFSLLLSKVLAPSTLKTVTGSVKKPGTFNKFQSIVKSLSQNL